MSVESGTNRVGAATAFLRERARVDRGHHCDRVPGGRRDVALGDAEVAHQGDRRAGQVVEARGPGRGGGCPRALVSHQGTCRTRRSSTQRARAAGTTGIWLAPLDVGNTMSFDHTPPLRRGAVK